MTPEEPIGTIDRVRRYLVFALAVVLSLYTLFTRTDSFDAYIAASPSIYWADEVIFDYENSYFLSGHATRSQSAFPRDC